MDRVLKGKGERRREIKKKVLFEVFNPELIEWSGPSNNMHLGYIDRRG